MALEPQDTPQGPGQDSEEAGDLSGEGRVALAACLAPTAPGALALDVCRDPRAGVSMRPTWLGGWAGSRRWSQASSGAGVMRCWGLGTGSEVGCHFALWGLGTCPSGLSPGCSCVVPTAPCPSFLSWRWSRLLLTDMRGQPTPCPGTCFPATRVGVLLRPHALARLLPSSRSVS